MGLLRLGRRGTRLFGFSGQRLDGKRVFDGSALIEPSPVPSLPGKADERQGPRGFSFERPGQLKKY